MSDTFVSGLGSQQCRLLRRGIRAGLTVEEAARRADYDIDTARLIAADDLKNPPPEEAYVLLYDPEARAAASPQSKEATMAKTEDEAGEYQRPDAAKAFDIYDKQISPKLAKMDTIKGDLSQPYDDIKEQAHFPRQVLNFIVKLENLDDDAKRDHFLLALADGLKHRKLFLPRDLVTMANGEDGNEIVGTEDREDGALLVDEGEDGEDGGELPLAAAATEEPVTEASDAEVAKQTGRGRPRKAKEDAPAARGRPASITSIAPPPAVEARPH